MTTHPTNKAIKSALSALVADARRVARENDYTTRQVSKLIFGDTRTLDMIIGGHTSITISRVLRAADRLKKL